MKHLIIPILLLAFNSHAAGIQKWVDEKGQVHYGDSPPSKVPTETIRVSRPPSNPGKSLPRIGVDQDTEQATAGEQDSDTPVETAAPEIGEEEAETICAEARKNLRVLNNSQRLRLQNRDGSSRAMTKEEKEARKKQEQQDIDQYCK